MATTAGLPATALRTMSRTALENAADSVLERRTLGVLFSKGAVLTDDGSSVFDQVKKHLRGVLTEAHAAMVTGATPTPPNFKVFDALKDNGRTGISVKSLDARTEVYRSEGRTAVLNRVKKMINEAANFEGDKGSYADGTKLFVGPRQIMRGELHLYLPAGRVSAGQEAQLVRVRLYAEQRGIVMIIRYVH